MSTSHKYADIVFITKKCIFDGLISVCFGADRVGTPCTDLSYFDKQCLSYFITTLRRGIYVMTALTVQNNPKLKIQPYCWPPRPQKEK